MRLKGSICKEQVSLGKTQSLLGLASHSIPISIAEISEMTGED
jgi:hypothetical protein